MFKFYNTKLFEKFEVLLFRLNKCSLNFIKKKTCLFVTRLSSLETALFVSDISILCFIVFLFNYCRKKF